MNYHILNSKEKDQSVRVAFHIPIPNTNNSVGVNYRIALKQFKPFTTSQVPWLIGAEVIQLQDGELYEHVISVVYRVKASDVDKQTIIDAEYNRLRGGTDESILKKLQSQLKYWGKDRNVP